MKTEIRQINIQEHLSKYPHNTDTRDRFERLIDLCMRLRREDEKHMDVDEFVSFCLYCYGGTIAASLVEYLDNRLD